jgi:LPXTG-site transpeptidase (sortase) family protein
MNLASSLIPPFSHISSIKFWRNAITVLALVISVFGISPFFSSVSADTHTVTNLNDSGAGSLRQAILDASAGDTITFNAGLAGQTITLASEIIVNKNLEMDGGSSGPSSIYLSGGGTHRIFRITAGTLRIKNMTLTNGYIRGGDGGANTAGTFSGLGGAVFVASGAGMTATSVNFSNSHAIGGNGGSASDASGFVAGGGGGAGGLPTANGQFGGGGGGSEASNLAGNGGYGGGGGGSAGSYSVSDESGTHYFPNPGGVGGAYGGKGSDGNKNIGVGYSGGGGGAGLGGAIFVEAGGALGLSESTFTSNSAAGGNGGNGATMFGGGGGGGGAALGSAVFSNGSLCIKSAVNFSSNSLTAGTGGTSAANNFGGTFLPGEPLGTPAQAGQAMDTSAGYFMTASSNTSCAVYDYAPTGMTFTPASLAENQPAGTTAGSLSTADPDAGDTFSYSLVPGTGSTDNDSFSILGNFVFTSKPLNYEAKSTYSIRVRTTDAAGKYIESAFSLTIANLADAPTNISLTASSVAENQPAGATVGTLSTTDEDGSPFTYNKQSGISGCDDSGNGSFFIAGTVLVSAFPLDHETHNSYSVCIRTTDSTGLTFDKAFTISVTDVNESPTGLTITPSTTLEENQSGAVAADLSTTDPDAVDTFTYSLVSGTGDSDNAKFSIVADQILTASGLDYETQSTYHVRVRSTDSGGQYIDNTATISILDVNEPPTNISLTSNIISENQTVGTSIGTLTTTDPDAGSTAFTYALEAGDAGCPGTDNGSFDISTDTLVSNAVFDYETKTSYAICVKSTDNDSTDPQSFYKAFSISINDQNDAPTDISLSSASIEENKSVGTLVGALSTTDADAGDTFTYALVSGTGSTDNDLFAISGSNLVSNEIFDYETKTSYSIRVQTTDSGGEIFAKPFTISITDSANEPPDSLTLDVNSINENMVSGTKVGDFSSHDPDGTTSFTYTLVGGGSACPGTNNGSFTISGSELDTAAAFNYETQNSYAICVQSTDSSTPAASMIQAFTIAINDVNETPTDLSLSPATVAENEASGTTVGTLSTTDPDAGDHFTYTLFAGTGDTDNASFSIDGSSLKTAAAFNYEDKSTYAIRVQTSDSGGLTTEKAFTISVTEVNEAPTDIALSPASIDEDAAIGSEVGTLSTTDVDAGDTFTYALVESGTHPDNAAFNITGDKVNTAVALNFEAKSSYQIDIQATDSGGLTTEKLLTITINNLNEAPTADHAIPDQNGTVGIAFSYAFPADTFSDQDGNTLTYTAELASGDPLPAWLSFTGATRTFSGTTTQVQTLSIRVTADDGSLTASTTFGLSMAAQAGNHAPVVVHPIPDQAVSLGTFEYTFPADTFADYDLDPLTYLAAQADGDPLPPGISFSSADRKISGSAISTIHTIRITALDGKGGEVYTDFNLGPVGNTAPYIQTPIPDQIIAHESTWSFTVPAATFADADGDTLTYSADQTNGLALPAWLSFDPATHTFSGSLPADAEDIFDIRVTVEDGTPGHTARDSFILGPWLVSSTPLQQMGISVLSLDVSGSGPTTIPAGTIRLMETADIRTFYGGSEINDLSSGVQVCYEFSTNELLALGVSLNRLAVGTSHNGGAWQILETSTNGGNQICAQATQFSLFDVFQLPAAGRSHKTTSLPATGFAPDVVTHLPEQPAERQYTQVDDVWLEIPTLGIKTTITGVPAADGSWDVSWLGSQLGWLEGTAFPGKDGNSVLAGHVVDSNGNPGIFADLGTLKWGDRIIVHAFNQKYVYEVRKVDTTVRPGDLSSLKHQKLPWLTLITCHGYLADRDTYEWRTVVQAVLIETELE